MVDFLPFLDWSKENSILLIVGGIVIAILLYNKFKNKTTQQKKEELNLDVAPEPPQNLFPTLQFEDDLKELSKSKWGTDYLKDNLKKVREDMQRLDLVRATARAKNKELIKLNQKINEHYPILQQQERIILKQMEMIKK